jgi:2-oxoisovalerate dehydrogenase E1 component beta subunit
MSDTGTGTGTDTQTLGKALNRALYRALEDDPKVMVLGEDIGVLGGVYRITDGLQARFGANRVVDTPLAESAIIGTAIGLAFRGYRPVCEIQFDGFVYPAFDQIVSQLARMHARTNGAVTLPITIRIPVGGGIGSAEHHSDSPEALFAHLPGIRVVTAATPQDAHTLLRQAIACDDPVIFFEPKRRYHVKGEVDEDSVELPMGSARVARPGDQVTLVTFGSLLPTALDAATAAADEGISIEVIDLRSLSPIDFPTIEASVRRTGRLVIAHEAPQTAGLGAEIAATITERCFNYLEAAPVRVTGHDIVYPPARLERHHVPDLDRMLYGVDRVLGRVPSPTESSSAGLA